MLDCSGLPARDDRDEATETADHSRPCAYMVRKDGTPFAILNAPPALASRTVTGFRLATPDACWTFDRI